MNRYFPYYRKSIKLALPIILSQVGQVAVQQADTMMVGYVGTLELAAAAFANSIFILGLVIIIGFSFGATPIIGHALNTKSPEYLKRILSNSYFLNITFCLFITTLLLLASFYFHLMGQDVKVETLSKPYYFTLVASLIPFIIFLTHKQFAEGIGNVKNAMYITLSGNIINIVLNYILIFGKFGMPQLGLFGAGISTLISRVYMAGAFIIIFKYSKKFKIYFNGLNIHLINKKLIKKLFFMGIPISTQMMMEFSAFGLSTIMAGWIGVISLASHQIALGLSTLSFMIVSGLGSATTVIISHQYGKRNLIGLKMATKASVHLVILFMSFFALLFISFNHILPLLYTSDNEVIKLSSKLLIIVAVFQIFDGMQVILISTLRGLGDVKHAMIYSFITYICLCIPISYFLGFYLNLGLQGIWFAFIIALAMAAILFYLRVKSIYKSIGNNTTR